MHHQQKYFWLKKPQSKISIKFCSILPWHLKEKPHFIIPHADKTLHTEKWNSNNVFGRPFMCAFVEKWLLEYQKNSILESWFC